MLLKALIIGGCSYSHRRRITIQLALLWKARLGMIYVSRSPEFSNCGKMNSVSVCTSLDQETSSISGSRCRQRSHSYYSPEDCKNYGVQTPKEETCLRPRSRYAVIFTFKTFFFLTAIPNYCVSVAAKLYQKQVNTEYTVPKVILQFWDIRASLWQWHGFTETEQKLPATKQSKQKGDKGGGWSYFSTHY